MEGTYQSLLDVVKAFPEHAGTRNDLALHLEIRDEVEKAVEHLDAVLQADPDYQPARQNLVRLLCDHGDLERAMTYLGYWKQQGRSVEVDNRKNAICIKVNGVVLYERKL